MLEDRLRLVREDRGPVLEGDAEALLELSRALRTLSQLPPGRFLGLLSLELVVAPEIRRKVPGRVCLPSEAWNVAASKFAEVATGREERSFFFGDCGFLHPRPDPDLGVVLLGDPALD